MLIAIDGGGTKTEAVLICNDGTVCARQLGGASNPHSVGVDQANQTLKDLVAPLLIKAAESGEPLRAVFAGLAGAGRETARAPFVQLLRSLLGAGVPVRVDSDALNCLSSGIGTGDGIVLIAGTGSAAFARRNGAMYQVGGWGHLLGDEGSGYAIGQQALNAVLRAHDGRGGSTELTALICAALKANVYDVLPLLYCEGKQLIASMAPIVLGCYDAASCRIVSDAASALNEHIEAAALHLADGGVPVVLAGGLFQSQRFTASLIPLLKSRFTPIRPTLPPLYGAAVEAAADAGIILNEQRFAQSYRHITEAVR